MIYLTATKPLDFDQFDLDVVDRWTSDYSFSPDRLVVDTPLEPLLQKLDRRVVVTLNPKKRLPEEFNQYDFDYSVEIYNGWRE